ncbi:hypothetical protein RRG08_017461 [Elysia crispata]|uniref:Uncharacterized protein n=1 Tax=Elysia crispata TaxID=231223 RepID=A0AAE0YIB1_9GAST|nr:hypothetical protein RRG08_017461 [Elysia crispata]
MASGVRLGLKSHLPITTHIARACVCGCACVRHGCIEMSVCEMSSFCNERAADGLDTRLYQHSQTTWYLWHETRLGPARVATMGTIHTLLWPLLTVSDQPSLSKG